MLKKISHDGYVSLSYGVVTWFAFNSLSDQIEMFSIDRKFYASFKTTHWLEESSMR